MPTAATIKRKKKKKGGNFAKTTLSDTLAADVKISNLYRYFERHEVNFVIYRDTLSGKNISLKAFLLIAARLK